MTSACTIGAGVFPGILMQSAPSICTQCQGPLGTRGPGKFFCLYCGKPVGFVEKQELPETAPPTRKLLDGPEVPMAAPKADTPTKEQAAKKQARKRGAKP